MSASYQFTWMKDDTPLDISNDRIIVCKAVFVRFYNYIDYVLIITNIIVFLLAVKLIMFVINYTGYQQL